MNRPRRIAGRIVVLLLQAVLTLAAAAQDTDGALPSPLVTAAVLEAKIAEAQDATDLTDDARERLIALYRKSLSNLEAARANQEAASAYRDLGKSAPLEIEALRAERERALTEPPLESLGVDAETQLAELERRLQEERADLAAVQARHDDLQDRLAFQEGRPAAVRQRLAEADEERAAAFAAYKAAFGDNPDAASGTTLAEALRWELESRYRALSTEITMLDQELLSRDARLRLLEAKRDKEAASIAWIRPRVEALNERIIAKRLQAAEQARDDAERVQRETEGIDPVLQQLSERNAELTRALNDLTAGLQALDRQRAQAEQLTERIAADYRDTRDTLDSSQLGGDLGAVLLEQRDALPDLQGIRQLRQERQERIGQSNTRRLRHRAEARRLGDIEAAVAAYQAELQRAPTPALTERLRELVAGRVELLDRVLETEELYRTRLRELDAAEEALLTVARDYEQLLLERLAWLRTEQPIAARDLLRLPAQLAGIPAAARGGGVDGTPLGRLVVSPVLWAGLLAAAALLLGRRSILATMRRIAGRLGKPTTDSFGHTVRVLGLTPLLALPLPLLLAAMGWALLLDPGGTEMTRALGGTLERVTAITLTVTILLAICVPNGLAAAHFRWREQNLALLRTESRRLLWIAVPAALLVHAAADLYPAQNGGTLARLVAPVAYGAIAWYLYRVFHPRRGVLAALRHTGEYPLIMRGYWLWYPLLVLYPIMLAVLALSGYLYTVRMESYNLTASMRLLLGLVLLNALARRWLLVVRRRLAYEAALERRQAARAAAQPGLLQESGAEAAELQFDEPEVDLSALSDDTSGLIRFSIGLAAVVGLLLIWSDALPALRVLDDQVLWHTSVLVDGEEQRQPITLVDLGLALLYAAGTWVLLRRLPALLEIALLRRSHMSAADRYAATTLTTYVVAAIGILLVLGTLGASWSQLQWMAAALSVGIGFGLQEIVANFISGLIILFERPIRVGDTVTVGDTDGIVTRIRIRATTIRNFDRKELLVPNKEFITGRLLNWSLSDPITRVVIVVGVAYGSDVDKALAIMNGVAEAHDHVVDDPPPFVTFDTFGDNALVLTLRAYVDSVDVRLSTITALNRAINRELAAAGIAIAFPQRDVHLDTSAPLRVQIEDRRAGAARADGASDSR